MASENDKPWTSAYAKWDGRPWPEPIDYERPAQPNSADLAADVLEAMTRKLADYDRLSAALTSAQEAATRNLERARLAEDERNAYRVMAESDAKEVDAVRDVLRAVSGESAADAARRAARTLEPCPGTVNHPLKVAIDRLAGVLGMRGTEAPIDAAMRVVRERDEARSWAERLGEAFDCHPGELPRVGKSLSTAMRRIAKCVSKVGADDDEIADAVRRLCDERDRLRKNFDEVSQQRDSTGRKLWESEQESARLREQLGQAQANYATLARNGSRAFSWMETLRVLLDVTDHDDVVREVKRMLDAHAALRAEAKQLRANLDEVTKQAAKAGPDFAESLRWAKDFGEWYESKRVKIDEPSTPKREPADGAFSPREWNERVKAKLHEIGFDISEAKAINGDCADGPHEPGPKLTPLRERLCKYDGFSMYRAEFDGDISLAWQRDDDGIVSKWTLEIVGLGTYAANVSSRTDDAHADVNAMLARYGYVLEQWP